MICRTQMTARSLHKYEGCNTCDKCHNNIFRSRVSYFINLCIYLCLCQLSSSQDYNDGKETAAERKKREEEEQKVKEKMEKAKKERRCPECEKKVKPVNCSQASCKSTFRFLALASAVLSYIASNFLENLSKSI